MRRRAAIEHPLSSPLWRWASGGSSVAESSIPAPRRVACSDAAPHPGECVRDDRRKRARRRHPARARLRAQRGRDELGVDTGPPSRRRYARDLARAGCWGDEATARLTALLPAGSTVWAAADRELLDRYGRHLLYLWSSDGRFVNAELVAEGDGTVMVFAPNTRHEGLLRSLEAEASAARRGLWGAC